MPVENFLVAGERKGANEFSSYAEDAFEKHLSRLYRAAQAYRYVKNLKKRLFLISLREGMWYWIATK
jgi:hypothetical protein